jgi:hypothetical protein
VVAAAPADGGAIRYRVISDGPPEPGAEPAEPGAEDGYVTLMHQAG